MQKLAASTARRMIGGVCQRICLCRHGMPRLLAIRAESWGRGLSDVLRADRCAGTQRRVTRGRAALRAVGRAGAAIQVRLHGRAHRVELASQTPLDRWRLRRAVCASWRRFHAQPAGARGGVDADDIRGCLVGPGHPWGGLAGPQGTVFSSTPPRERASCSAGSLALVASWKLYNCSSRACFRKLTRGDEHC